MNLPFPEKAKEILNECVEEYEAVVGNIDDAARSQDHRAYGGMVRMTKGNMTESIVRNLLCAAWVGMGNDAARLQFANEKHDIPIRREYVGKITDEELRKEILGNLSVYKVKHGTDIHALVDGVFTLSVECKAYTENAMLKRILFDAFLLQQKFPKLNFALVQLENQMGGDFGAPSAERVFGSRQSHTLMSYMDTVDLHIITLLEGNRQIKQPIHKPEFYKPLKRENLEKAVATLAKLLIPPKK